MEARDLMIGDWVLDKAVSDKPVYIEQINEKNVHYKFGNGYISSGVELLEPIPLTPEILEKNGFTGGKYKDYCGFVFYLSADGFREIGLTMSYKDNILWCEKIKPNYPNSFGDKYSIHHLDYVHELQHAMRLCRIEKEIVL